MLAKEAFDAAPAVFGRFRVESHPHRAPRAQFRHDTLMVAHVAVPGGGVGDDVARDAERVQVTFEAFAPLPEDAVAAAVAAENRADSVEVRLFLRDVAVEDGCGAN